MNLNLKKRTVYAALFGVYQIVINLFFGVENFLSSLSGSVIFMIYTFGFIFFIQFILLTTISYLKVNEVQRRIFFSSSFLVTSLISGSVIWWFLSSTHELFFVFISAFLISSLLPSLLSILNFIFQEAESKIMVSVASSEGDVLVGQNKPQLFILENENGKQILKVATTDLICFEANDNYVITYYLNKEGQVKKTMDRFSLKKIDDLLKSAGIAFERVHKSFIVNPDYILKIKGKAQAYKLEIKHLDTEVPVSRSYDISTLKP